MARSTRIPGQAKNSTPMREIVLFLAKAGISERAAARTFRPFIYRPRVYTYAVTRMYRGKSPVEQKQLAMSVDVELLRDTSGFTVFDFDSHAPSTISSNSFLGFSTDHFRRTDVVSTDLRSTCLVRCMFLLCLGYTMRSGTSWQKTKSISVVE